MLCNGGEGGGNTISMGTLGLPHANIMWSLEHEPHAREDEGGRPRARESEC